MVKGRKDKEDNSSLREIIFSANAKDLLRACSYDRRARTRFRDPNGEEKELKEPPLKEIAEYQRGFLLSL